MTYEEAIAFFNSLVNYERKPPVAGTMRREVTLERVKELAIKIGNPERTLTCIHVAGTKGKGSTCAFSESILRAHGLKTGLYTSPHLVDIRERIQIGGRLIDKRLFSRIAERLAPLIEPRREDPDRRATYFETLTHLAFIAFEETKVEAAVVEVGMGGRLDATNIVTPKVSVITPIGIDHVQQLGDTIPKIAWEKAGIIKPGIPVVANPGPQEAIDVMKRVAKERSAPIYLLGVDFIPKDAKNGNLSVEIKWTGQKITGLQPPLVGRHQRQNAATAIAAVAVFLESIGRKLEPEAVRKGVSTTRWEGRIQKAGDNPPTYLDGAHNVQSLTALIATMRELHPKKPLVFAFGCAADKDFAGMLSVLRKEAAEIVFTRSALPRALTPEELVEAFKGVDNPPFSTASPSIAAYNRVREKASAHSGVAVITGSLYIVGEIIKFLSERRRKKK
jgi:dihydrofolate synthase/folylpolyglutamate synthase